MKLDHPIDIDLLGFIKTGRFDCLALGQTREWISHSFPDPDDFSADASMRQASTWRFGNIELHFSGDVLCLIFSDYIGTLDGGPSLSLSPWILNERPPLSRLIRGLNARRLDFSIMHRPALELVKLKMTVSGVVLSFDGSTGSPDDYPLSALSLLAGAT